MNDLTTTIREIRDYLLSSTTEDYGVVLIYHDVDSYSWGAVVSIDEVDTTNLKQLYLPFKSEHRELLKRVDPLDREYLIATHIAEVALTLFFSNQEILNRLTNNFRKGAQKTNELYTTEKRLEAAKKANQIYTHERRLEAAKKANKTKKLKKS